ncbi:glycoside hydrolase family 13 protein [Spirochaeta cellobiosiphila]|uniref:glycoside hydrolase family 13 protein n=1 Tax=Spirochaeta cellobiosiphila TaxID=504483 RepID=UPI000426F1EC|nr:alpha-glucosidase [Spirochaeta cellobiosiphila]
MKKAWWKERVVYQIYPRSFYDSNGDGIGDLQGIIQKLDYLKDLGVGVIWLSPIYKSPNDDNGYDISDYQDIMAEFGTLEDWDELLREMHQRDIKMVMDLVVNHSSDEHQWFIESKKSRDNPYRDYYIWQEGRDGMPPNNWKSWFSGSAWEFHEPTQEYYLHLFSKKQPDLNWDNPDLRTEIFNMMTWWLEKGIDGFRMDVINMISKVPGYPDAEVVDDHPYQFGGQHFLHGPKMMPYLQEMKDKVLQHYDIITVGETPSISTTEASELTDENSGVLNMVFQFELMDMDGGRDRLQSWSLSDLKRITNRWQNDLNGKGWNSNYLCNHDQPRPVSRFGNDQEYRVESAKLLATFNHLIQGTPYIYQGEEIGMTNVDFQSIEAYRDIETLNWYKEEVNLKGGDPSEILTLIKQKSRDNARTPVQWDGSSQGGFTTGTPWIQVNPNYVDINVEQALADKNSIYYYYQKLIALRREYDIIVYGQYDIILPEHKEIYAFTRTLEDQVLLVILNFSEEIPLFYLPEEIAFNSLKLLISNYSVNPKEDIDQFVLRPYEARVYQLVK